MLSILLDIEWLLSTLFDASLLTFEPPATAAPFFVVPFRVSPRVRDAPCRRAAKHDGIRSIPYDVMPSNTSNY